MNNTKETDSILEELFTVHFPKQHDKIRRYESALQAIGRLDSSAPLHIKQIAWKALGEINGSNT